MEKKTTAQDTVDHLGTVLLNVVRMNRPWDGLDLLQLADYVKQSSIDPRIKAPLMAAIADASKEVGV